MENPFIVLAEVVRLLDEREINYVLVGSLASSMHRHVQCDGRYRSGRRH